MFTNRKEAGQLLAKELTEYKNNKDAVIVSIPRGGVPIGYEISQKFNLPLEVALSKKIGHPNNKEYAIGAVTLHSKILTEATAGVSQKYIDDQIEHIRDVLKARHKRFHGNMPPMELKNKTVILVDDGMATGNTLISSIQLIAKQKPFKIIVALPVASHSAIEKIKNQPVVDIIICLETPSHFRAVGQFYKDFKPVNDVEVMELLKEANDLYLKNLNNH